MKKDHFDFGGWATKNDLLCADGRTIRKNAFKDDDGRTVPLVWQHNHDDPTRVIGHALLENKEDGVYAYCSFNNSELGQHVKELVRHRDVCSLSIYANQLKQNGGDVIHGVIREVSVVLAGANPGAVIEFPMLAHGEEATEEAVIWNGEEDLELTDDLSHAAKDDEEKKPEAKEDAKEEPKPGEKKEKSKPDDSKEEKPAKDEQDMTVQEVLDSMNEEQRKVVEYLVGQALEGADEEKKDDQKAEHDAMDDDEDEELSHADGKEEDGKTIQDVLDSMTDVQRKVTEYLVGQALQHADSEEDEEEDEEDDNEASHSDDEGEELTMKKNVFEHDAMNEQEENVLTHAQMATIIKDAKSMGSLKASVLAHSAEYGIDQIDYLQPEYREVSGNGAPQFIKRDNTWVAKVMKGVHHTPFAKVKSTFADITGEEARARGYIKGNRKKEEVFSLLKRETSPDTVYKKQKIDREDQIDIETGGFDMVAWLKSEMRMMLDEELARAFIIGDGRAADSDDKIKEDKIRPILRDDSLFVIRKTIEVAEGQAEGEALVDSVTYASEDYQGSGNCVAFMTRRQHSKLKLLKNKIGDRVYKNDGEIASALGVSEIIFVPQMSDSTTIRTDSASGKTYRPLVIIVDLDDYNVGADKGGAINMFDDFDIDYNQMKYLIETRCSGALVKPYSAIVIEEEVNP